jgi:hypothetical protein
VPAASRRAWTASATSAAIPARRALPCATAWGRDSGSVRSICRNARLLARPSRGAGARHGGEGGHERRHRIGVTSPGRGESVSDASGLPGGEGRQQALLGAEPLGQRRRRQPDPPGDRGQRQPCRAGPGDHSAPVEPDAGVGNQVGPGNFTQPDSIAQLDNPANGDLYAYAADSPTNNIDPTGAFSWTTLFSDAFAGGVVAAIGGCVTGALTTIWTGPAAGGGCLIGAGIGFTGGVVTGAAAYLYSNILQ